MSIYRLVILLLLAGSIARADIVYDFKNDRWYIEGGVMAPYLGEYVNAESAVEAINLGNKARDEGKYWTALAYYAEVYDENPNDILAPEALYQAAGVYRNRNQFDKAFEYLNTIVQVYPAYEKYTQVIALQYKIADDLREGERPYYWGLIPGFKDYDSAMQYYNEIVENGPYTDYAPLALMQRAQLAKEREKPEEAIDALDRLINYYPGSILAPDAYLALGETHQNLVKGAWYDQGATRQAIDYYQDLLIRYPNSNLTAQAEDGLGEMKNTLAKSKLRLGDFYYNYRNNSSAAKVFYNQAITVDPYSEAADKARAQLEKIENNVPPPMTPADMIFGRYKDPSRARAVAADTAADASEDAETFSPLQTDQSAQQAQPEPNSIPVNENTGPAERTHNGGPRRGQ